MVDRTIETCGSCKGTGFVQAEEIRQTQRTAAELHKMSQLLVATAEDLSTQLFNLVQRLQEDDK